ncbi:MAG: hypothetical protein MNSN_03970 [Minisyncoccus archaeiphilus]|uniref:hypothetical protein n=1 Tax=Minisyncoccus archaeiphilus TaxID=3238481 RepID=UPI002B18E6AA|nr:MAG: hypothetical protein MNSN_03970 [Candidatus Parcubacteria bacterium]
MNLEKFVFNEGNEDIQEEINNEVCSEVMDKTREFLDKIDSTKDAIIYTPEKKKDEVPVFYAPGWAVKADSASVQEIMKTISEQGREVISSSFSNRQEVIDYAGDDEYHFTMAELHKALIIMDTINDLAIDRCDLIGYSEGGINASIAACLLGEEKIRNLVLVCPAGMIGKDSCFDLIKRFAVTEELEEIKNRDKKNMNSSFEYNKDIIEYLIRHPEFTRQEIKAMTEMDIFNMTKYLKGKGIGVGLVAGGSDKVFPIEKAIDNVEENVDFLVSTKGDHGSIVFDKKHILLVEDLLTNMAKEANRRKYENSY